MSISSVTPNLANSGQLIYFGTAAPLTADAYGLNFNVGDIVVNTAPAAGSAIGWICTGAGSPGTWDQFGGTVQDAIFNGPTNASIVTGSFFLSGTTTYLVVGAVEVHSTAGTDGGAVTLDVVVDPTTGAPGGGTSVLTAPFNAKATANVVQTAAIVAGSKILPGQRLSLKVTGTTTSLAGVIIKVGLQKV
jgi:hypothetical protein